MTTIVVVRHGETTWTRERRLQGWAPAPLTDLGREQSDRLGAELSESYDIDRIQSSDLHRTEETVDVLLDHLGAPVAFESAWRERDLGVHQGLSVDEMFERFPEFDLGASGADAARRRPESGERLVDVRERVIERWETTLAESEPGESILVVTHGGPIRLLLGHLKGLDIVASVLEQAQGYCSINELAFDHESGATKIVRENDTGHC